MKPSFIIRSVTASDLPAWRTLWAGYNAFHGRKDETALADEITRTTWKRFFDPLEPIHSLASHPSLT